MPAPTCPACHSCTPILLGQLGRLLWYRCRYCGIDIGPIIDTEKEA